MRGRTWFRVALLDCRPASQLCSVQRLPADNECVPRPKVVVLLVAGAVSLAVPFGAVGSGPRRVGSAGVTVALPSGWRFFRQGVAPQSKPYADPLVRIVAASAAIVPYPQGCKAELFRFARSAVGVMVVEWIHPQPSAHLPPPPQHFTAKNLPVRAGAVECWPGSGGGIEFSLLGRSFAAYLLLSKNAPPSAAARGRAVLDTLTAARR